ncbi:uncharacterized protein [Clytia hemisphaerica]|uniref:uncharacterized protein n=1 Tax=Clytia hemisphaerica TaxID=252671 RepID=UPI0034D4E4D2
MGKNDHCCVSGCKNDKRYINNTVKRSHVARLKWHRFTSHQDIRKEWTRQVRRGRPDFSPGQWTFVCSNHFPDGEPTTQNPFPKLFMTTASIKNKTPTKRRSVWECRRKLIMTPPNTDTNIPTILSTITSPLTPSIPSFSSAVINGIAYSPYLPSRSFEAVTREYDVRFYTGFNTPKILNCLFDYLKLKASTMRYWDGQKKTLKPTSYQTRLSDIVETHDYDISLLNYHNSKPGPSRKLSLEQEFFLVLMKLRIDSLQHDLAYRFGISIGKVSQIFITWIKLMSKELGVLIIWPSKEQIAKTLPKCFKKFHQYKKTRTIIDCTEVFTETPSSLESHCLLWSDYKHHCTIKFMVCITPNGSVSWISPAYGGRTTDVHIVRNSGFLKLLEPYDLVMADRGFKIKTDLAMKQCSLAIPPSASKGVQMTEKQSKETSTVANVRIYVEQAIKNIKDYRILKNELKLLYLPIADDIIKICCALNNLKNPLCT